MCNVIYHECDALIMERPPSPTGAAIKKKLSISDVADALGISRPTLYRYIDDYDRGDYSRMNGNLLRLFDIVTQDDIGPEEAQTFLVNLRNTLGGESIGKETTGRDLERSRNMVAESADRIVSMRRTDNGPRWSDGPVRVVSIGQDGRSMVIFDGPEGSYRLRLWMEIDGEPYMISEYEEHRGKRFFLVDDVLPRPIYRFDVVCETSEGEVGSGLQELRFR